MYCAGLNEQTEQSVDGTGPVPWSFTKASISSGTPLCHSVMSTCRE